jgi:Family of unknown function (DUF6920)
VLIGAARFDLEPPEEPELGFRAIQTINLHRPEFDWRARAAPLGCISAPDSLESGIGRLQVRLFGFLPIAIAHSTAATKAELQRYLAELACVPDAILCNPAIGWTVLHPSRLRARCA